jgi:phage shock protein E
MNNWYVILVLLGVIFFFFLQGGVGAEVKPEQAWKLIEEGALLIDVRTDGEFNAGHLPDARHIPYEQVDRLKAAIGEDKGRSVVVYCRSGRRSGIAKKSLVEAGYTNIVNGGAYSRLSSAQPR